LRTFARFPRDVGHYDCSTDKDMKINGNAIRIGNVSEHKDRLWVAVKTQAVKPGKGGAFNQVELKDIRNGTKLNERFRADEQVERVRLEQRPAQFLFAEENLLTFMDNETYEQTQISTDLIGENAVFLQDGMEVQIESYEGEPLSVQLPETVVLEIVEADAVVKGQTASSSYKPAVLENGVKILVPPHVEAGTRVVVRTEDSTYVERAKD
jgi:elongation factor P